MGFLFKKIETFIQSIDTDSVFVEIGSDRGEGSTEYFSRLALKNNTKLITVDIDANVGNRLSQVIPKNIYDNIEFVTASGRTWAETKISNYNKKICCLYLDNFDYDWDVYKVNNQSVMNRMIDAQKADYLTRGVEMTNRNCLVEHLAQMVALLPHMAARSIVICDDTVTFNDCYIGKGGAVVPYLLVHGYEILLAEDHGVILGRNI